ncbi:hypothetical protein VULLAG_LOCUS5332 [Vulpes lagopus]
MGCGNSTATSAGTGRGERGRRRGPGLGARRGGARRGAAGARPREGALPRSPSPCPGPGGGHTAPLALGATRAGAVTTGRGELRGGPAGGPAAGSRDPPGRADPWGGPQAPLRCSPAPDLAPAPRTQTLPQGSAAEQLTTPAAAAAAAAGGRGEASWVEEL